MASSAALATRSPRVARKRSAVRLRLLKAGKTLIGDKGADNVPVNLIAETADCSVGGFYTHFVSKQALVDTLKNELITPINIAMDAIRPQMGGAPVALAAGLRVTLTLAMSDPAWGRFVFAMTVEGGAMNEGFGARARADLQRGRRDGDFQITDEAGAMSILAGTFLMGVLQASRGLMTPASVNAAARHVLQAYGVPAEEAERISTQPLPEIEAPFDPQLLPHFAGIVRLKKHGEE